MFDQVGQRRSRRHQWGALLLALAINGAGLVAVVVNSGAQFVKMVEVPIAWERVELFPAAAAPAPAGPPAGAAAAVRVAPKPTPKPEPVPDPEPTPDTDEEPVDEVEPRFTQVLDQLTGLAAQSTGSGQPGDGPGIDGGGGGQGCLPGQDCAPVSQCPPGVDCSTVVNISSADVKVKRRVAPRYPESARTLQLEEVRCIVTFSIDSRGKPAGVEIDGCPTVFHPALEEAAWKWRFYPYKDGSGAAVPATFRLSTIFRLR